MMRSNARLVKIFAAVGFLLITAEAGFTQARNGRAVLWEPVNIKKQNLFLGPGGTAHTPNLRRITFIKKETGGNNLKYRIKDGSGREWVAKIADESRPEAAAVRLLWGIGYKTEINYLVPRLTIPTRGTYNNVRLEARPANIERGERWDWQDNPFADARELRGLKIMMAMINNWDLKTGNNIILETGGRHHYVVSDLGSAFGKMAITSGFFFNRFGRSVDEPAAFMKSKFINEVTDDGFVDFAYNGKGAGLLDDITPADAAWAGRLLGQLSNKQLDDAFRAANYSASERRTLIQALTGRIRELQRVGYNRLEAVR
jgi:hypothetical protein